MQLCDLARSLLTVHPQVSYFLLTGNPIPQSYPIWVEFVTGAADRLQTGQLASVMGDDFYVQDIRSQVWRPAAFAGSIFKAQSDVYNAQNTNLSARLRVEGGGMGQQYVVNGDFSPLELIAPPISGPTVSDACGQGFVLTYGQTMKLDVAVKRTLAADELPMRVWVQLRGWRLGCMNFNNMSPGEARSKAVEALARLPAFMQAPTGAIPPGVGR